MSGGWIGVDFDGTLATETGDILTVGAPIPKMVDRVKCWLLDGKDVRIFTARVGPSEDADVRPLGYDTAAEFVANQRRLVEEFCRAQFDRVLPVTATKDFRMLELWDDRAVQVVSNTGLRADGMLAAIVSAHVALGYRLVETKLPDGSERHEWFRPDGNLAVAASLS